MLKIEIDTDIINSHIKHIKHTKMFYMCHKKYIVITMHLCQTEREVGKYAQRKS